MQECEEFTGTNVAVYPNPFLHQQWEKMPKGKKENCELCLCQMELATDFIKKTGLDSIEN